MKKNPNILRTIPIIKTQKKEKTINVKNIEKVKLKKINKVIEKARSYVIDDGGDMELYSFDNKKNALVIKIKGACVGCPYVGDTYDSGIKEILKIELPFLKEISFI
ncbi:MAG: NifU family protein [Mycoplasmataceae bacterium]|jgi:Fe-S cluster biogenesis protein NfuA|nr:NifU family protein [Mycoplasmataceae bacterium]